MRIKVYQTIEDRNNLSHVKRHAPFKCTRKNAWLGHGYYFWDTNINWAHEWGENSYKKEDRNYMIIQSHFNLDENCFDIFGSVKCQQECKDVIDELKRNSKTKHLSNFTVSNVIQYMKDLKIFDYSAIRAGDMRSKIKISFNKNKREHTYINQRVQICIIDKDKVLEKKSKIVHPQLINAS